MFTLEVGGAAADCTHTDLWGFDGVELPLLLLLSVENELMQNREMLGGGGIHIFLLAITAHALNSPAEMSPTENSGFFISLHF